jgi:signal transduction histidine kinase
MPIFETREPSAEVQRQLGMANSQLALYARDLKRIVDAERKKNRELAEAHARLRLLEQLKTDFLAFISHELRTPLNVVAAIDLFDTHQNAGEQAEVIDLIRKRYEPSGLIRKELE